jgi:cystathionine beta-lyase/cystathionine gamma-synthase
VYYPGLDDHPQRELAARQMPTGSGGMLAFEVDSPERARRVLSGLRLITLAESLGGVESLASHPASMTHASVPPAERAALGISDALIRISTGIEDAADLVADLEQALEA